VVGDNFEAKVDTNKAENGERKSRIGQWTRSRSIWCSDARREFGRRYPGRPGVREAH
jgi:hypothetical protein